MLHSTKKLKIPQERKKGILLKINWFQELQLFHVSIYSNLKTANSFSECFTVCFLLSPCCLAPGHMCNFYLVYSIITSSGLHICCKFITHLRTLLRRTFQDPVFLASVSITKLTSTSLGRKKILNLYSNSKDI